MAHELAAHGTDARERDEVTERHDGAEGLDRDDIPEEVDQIVVLGETTARAGVRVGELLGARDARIDDGRGPHGHGAVREDDGHVEREPDREHAHARQVPVDRSEPGQHRQRHAERGPLQVGRHEAETGVEERADHDDGRIDEDRRPEMCAVGTSEGADEGADHRSRDDRKHRRDGTSVRLVRRSCLHHHGVERVAGREDVDDLDPHVLGRLAVAVGGVDDRTERVVTERPDQPLGHAVGLGLVEGAPGLGDQFLGETVGVGAVVLAAPGEDHRRHRDHLPPPTPTHGRRLSGVPPAGCGMLAG